MSTNIENTKKAYAAFASGDIATLTDLIAPDCTWHVGGRNPLSGDYVGHEAILGYFGKLFELTEGTFAVELVDLAELPSTGLMTCLVRVTGTRNGQTLDMRMIELGRANHKNQIVECWWFPEDAYAGDEFFASTQIVLPEQTTATATV